MNIFSHHRLMEDHELAPGYWLRSSTDMTGRQISDHQIWRRPALMPN